MVIRHFFNWPGALRACGDFCDPSLFLGSSRLVGLRVRERERETRTTGMVSSANNSVPSAPKTWALGKRAGVLRAETVP